MALFRDMTEDAIQRSLSDDRAASITASLAEVRDLVAFYEGGKGMEAYLVKRPGEAQATTPARADRFRYRKERAHNANYFGRLTDAIKDGFTGDDIDRHIGGDAPDKILQELWKSTRIDLVQQEYGLSTVLTGNGYVNIVGRPDGDGIAIVPVHPFNVTPKPDTFDPYLLAEVEERRAYVGGDGKESVVTWVWNEAWGRLYDEKGKRLSVDPITGWDTLWADPNPYGVVPYVHWRGRPSLGQFEGLSYVRDQMTLQKELYNRTNDLMVLCHLRAFGVPVFKDLATNQLDWSEYGAIEVGAQGDAWMLEPSGNIDGMVMSIEKLIDWMFQTGSVPVDVVKGSVAESGVALIVKWQPFVRVVETLRTAGAISEADLVRKVCAVAKQHGFASLPDANKADPVITYDQNIIPTDDAMERTQDQLDVEAGRMALTDYLIKWRPEITTEEEAKAYLQRIAEEKALQRASQPQQPQGGPLDLTGEAGVESGLGL